MSTKGFGRVVALAALAMLGACGSKTQENDAEAGVSPTAEIVQSDAAAPSGGAVWTVDESKSRIEFIGVQAGKELTGAFSAYDVSITFDPADLSTADIRATIDTASAATGDRQRDDALSSRDWLSSAAFPTALFESTDVRAAGSGYEARGTLTIRGVSKDLTAPFSVAITADRAVADGEVTLIRTDFGVGQGEFATGEWVGLDVKVKFHIEANR